MSLINDALKRTREAARQSAAPRPSDAESYRITSQPETKSNRPRTVVWIAAIAGVIVVAIAGFVAYRLLNNTPATDDVPQVKRVLPPPPASLVPAVAPVAPPAVANTAAVASNDDQTADSDTTADSDSDSEPPTPKPVVVPDPPKLVLEGITSDSLGRAALINGVELKVGEEFMGATVTSIEGRVVKLKFGEKEIVLRMF